MVQSGSHEASRKQVLAFRLQGQYLSSRLSSGALVKAAGSVGIRNSPPGSAELAFHARIADFSLENLENALSEAKTLLGVWSIRSSPFFFPTGDTTIFTAGLLPFDEEGLRYCIKGVLPALDLDGKTTLEALDIIADAASEALEDRQLTKGQLSTAVSKGVPKGLLYWCKGCEAYHVPENFFRLAIQKAEICFVPRNTSKELLFTCSDRWLGAALPRKDLNRERQEALRRYLHGYGPSTYGDFAVWAGILPANARQVWQSLEDELVEVEFEKTSGLLLKEDLKAFESPPTPKGVRFLPPYDPYLLASDRTTLIPDKGLHSQFWKAIGNPGAVLVDGEIVGSWRPQKKGKKLILSLSLIREVTAENRLEIEHEAELLAPIKGASSVEVIYED